TCRCIVLPQFFQSAREFISRLGRNPQLANGYSGICSRSRREIHALRICISGRPRKQYRIHQQNHDTPNRTPRRCTWLYPAHNHCTGFLSSNHLARGRLEALHTAYQRYSFLNDLSRAVSHHPPFFGNMSGCNFSRCCFFPSNYFPVCVPVYTLHCMLHSHGIHSRSRVLRGIATCLPFIMGNSFQARWFRLRTGGQGMLFELVDLVNARLAAAVAVFLLPAGIFWLYFSASILLVAGLIKILKYELPQTHGLDKVMPFGRLFLTIPFAVFGTEHLTNTADIAKIVPRWFPAHAFWVYLVGIALITAAVSITVQIQSSLAATLLGATLFSFVLLIHIPNVIAQPSNRFFWAIALRSTAFSG